MDVLKAFDGRLVGLVSDLEAESEIYNNHHNQRVLRNLDD